MTTELWSTLLPLALATAIMPVELAITLLLLRSPHSRSAAAAWIAGMTVVRLVQYAIFGLILDAAMDDGDPGQSPVEGAILLVVAVLLLVSAARKWLKQPDEDEPPPAWMTAIGSLGPGRGLALGVGFTSISPKLWALTIGAVGAISDAQLDFATGWAAFIVWLVVAESIHLLALLFAVIAPARAGVGLARATDLLERYNRPVLIGASIIFGVWFLYKALVAFTY